jgi:DNA-binding CsgD family transcriptional regulator
MRLLNLPDSSTRPTCFARALPSAVESIGRPEFGSSVFEIVRRLLGVDHLTVFVSSPGAQPIPLVVDESSQARSQQYISRFWRFDPVNTLLDGDLSDNKTWMLHVKVDDLPNFSWRSECYHSAGLTERLSLISRRPEGLMRVNFYRGHNRQFYDDFLEKLDECAPLLIAVLWRHQQAVGATPRHISASTFRTRLKKVAPTLSDRELDVCSLVVGGVTSEGIALELGIGVNTVLTYRKRAYARLHISSQNELMRYLM